jgi:diguanylate cyclase (GGDEF)-like protein/PAS domain S-box-containing protein
MNRQAKAIPAGGAGLPEEADAVLGRELRLFKRSVESAQNGIVICAADDPELPILYVNPAFERMTGYSRAEVAGRNCRFLQGDDRHQPELATLREGLRAGREVHVVLRNYRKDGALLWNELYISPVRDPDGTLTHFVGIINDLTEQRRYESELMFTINHDVLTGLPNRTLLEDRLRQACSSARRFRRQVAVLFVGLDGFKPINDSLGHRVGDHVLVEAARRMSEQVRADDTVARMGGDEFIVLLGGVEGEEAVLGVAERLQQALAQPYAWEGRPLHVTASIGIAMGDGALESPSQLIQQADLAMFKAKQEGRNNWQWFSDDLGRQVGDRLVLRNDLRRAIRESGLELHFQPQVDARSGRVVCVEALLRWLHPERGLVPAAELVRAAEDAGQIVPLSQWVLREACLASRRLAREGGGEVAVAVNVSPVCLKRSQFAEAVLAVLAETGQPPALLELEVTESVFVDEADNAIAALQSLRERGVRVVVDDFGTGLSSLGNLKRLPLDKVKVHQSFIQDISGDRHDAAIIQGIIAMAHHLRLQVVAEGVETEAQYFFLRKVQCDALQGYYLARPMPLSALGAFLATRNSLPSAVGGGETPRQTLLLLDDEQNILRALGRVLRRDSYEILMANRAEEAFDILARNDVQVIITDQRMPEMSGTEFLSRVKGLYPDTVRIILSGYTDLKTVTDAINQGEVYKFLLKPWDDEDLRSVVAQAFRHWADAAPGRKSRP